jgi:hypothetical protein
VLDEESKSPWLNQLSQKQLENTIIHKKGFLIFRMDDNDDDVAKEETSFLNMLNTSGARDYNKIPHNVAYLEPNGTYNIQSKTDDELNQTFKHSLKHRGEKLYHDTGFAYASRWHLSDIMKPFQDKAINTAAHWTDAKTFVLSNLDQYGRTIDLNKTQIDGLMEDHRDIGPI